MRHRGVRFSSSLVLGFSLVALGGCSSSAGSDVDGPVTITFLRHDNPNYLKADDDYFQWYEDMHPNVHVADTTVDFKTLSTSLNGDLKANQFGYDLVLIPPARLCSFADNLADVPDDVVTLSEAENTFFRAPLQGSVCQGHLKGLPVEYNLEYGGVVVNMEKYQAQFPGKTPGWTDWEAFLTEAAALTEYDGLVPKANGLDIDPAWSPPMRHIFVSQILQRGGTYLDANKNFVFTSMEAHDALTAMADWVVNRKVMSMSLIPDKNTGVTTRLAAGATGYGWGTPEKPQKTLEKVKVWVESF